MIDLHEYAKLHGSVYRLAKVLDRPYATVESWIKSDKKEYKVVIIDQEPRVIELK